MSNGTILDLWDKLIAPHLAEARLTDRQQVLFAAACFLHAWSVVRQGEGRGWSERDRQTIHSGITALIQAVNEGSEIPQPIVDAVSDTYPDQDDAPDSLLTSVIHILNCLLDAVNCSADRAMQCSDAASSACIAVVDGDVERSSYRQLRELVQNEFSCQLSLLSSVESGTVLSLE